MSRRTQAAGRAPRPRDGATVGVGGSRRRLALVAGAVAVLGASVAAASLAARSTPAAELSAEEVVERNLAARGGLEAWRKIQTMVWIGHLDGSHAPVPGTQFELDQKRPNKTRLEIHALGDRSLRAFDGLHGFKMRPSRGRPELEPYTPQELKAAQAAHGIDGPLIDHQARGGSVTLQGLDDIQGHRAFHLKVHLAKGGEEEVWVDAKTFLDLRFDRMVDGPGGGQRRVSTTYGDYRAVDGVEIPFLVATGGGQGAPPDKMQLDRVMLNVPLEDAAFASPLTPGARSRSRLRVAAQAAPDVAAGEQGTVQR